MSFNWTIFEKIQQKSFNLVNFGKIDLESSALVWGVVAEPEMGQTTCVLDASWSGSSGEFYQHGVCLVASSSG